MSNTKGCGRILGHGEVCFAGYLCSNCNSKSLLEEENTKLKQAIMKLDLIIESDQFEGWSDQYNQLRQVIDSLKEINEKK